VLAGVAQKREQIDRPQPVGVVRDARSVLARAEIEEPLQLGADAGDVPLDLLAREQDALLGFAARIADHPGAAADDRDRRVAESLQPRKPHHREQRADVEA
jgi:hypothetical protein